MRACGSNRVPEVERARVDGAAAVRAQARPPGCSRFLRSWAAYTGVMAKAVSRPLALAGAAGLGAVAGLVGVAAMTASEKVEQSWTSRPNSFVPGRAVLTLLGRRPGGDAQPFLANQALHWGTGALLGALRGVWAAVGLRGLRADVAHTVVRLSFDQTVENATGVGAPPHTWPLAEQGVDMFHKAVFSFVTGVVADRLVKARLESHRGAVSH